MDELGSSVVSRLEALKKIDAGGNEYWLASELQQLVGITSRRAFSAAIRKARTACEQSGHEVQAHFLPDKPGAGLKSRRLDLRLSRYACYLVLMNGDPGSEAIARCKTYFALETRRQELGQDGDDSVEQASRLFVAMHAEAKMKREGTSGPEAAEQAYQEVEEAVRQRFEDPDAERKSRLRP